MPSIHGRHDGRAAIVTVAIIDAAHYKTHKASLNQGPLKGVVPVKALFDTGATKTMITSRIVSRLGLRLVNKLDFASLTGVHRRNGYLFHVGFYQSPPANETEVSNIQVFREVINGGELPDGTTFDVMLGMDVITSGNLRINQDGTFVFRFGPKGTRPRHVTTVRDRGAIG